ncbi:MAG: hypothetical protein AAF637_10110 [Pseudomonadota bacterium]
MRKGRIVAFWSIIVLMVFAVGESVSYFVLKIIEQNRPGIVLDLFINNHFSSLEIQDTRKYKAGLYDPDLGWDYEPESSYEQVNRAGQPYRMSWGEDGARSDGISDVEPYIATYGDSFIAGEEVNDQETWQYYLSEAIGKRVLNFGTSGYGTDQSLMKFRKHVEESQILPVTVLGIFEENIKRNLNEFRPFYRPADGIVLGFKPRFSCEPHLDLKPNPLAEFEEDAAALREIAESTARTDAYAQAKIRFRFPYSFRVGQILLEFVRVRSGMSSWLVPASLDLWQDPEALRLMDCIIEEFLEICRRNDSVPVILFIPKAPSRESRAPYADFAEQLAKRHSDAVVIDAGALEFDSERFLVTPTGGHVSPYGNRIIADALRDSLGL